MPLYEYQCQKCGERFEIIQKFFEEVAYVEFGGPTSERGRRLEAMRSLTYNDLEADRNTVAIVQALEAILAEHAAGRPGAMVEVNGSRGGLTLWAPGVQEPRVLYHDSV